MTINVTGGKYASSTIASIAVNTTLTTNATTASGSNVLNFASTSGVALGQSVAGAGIATGSQVTAFTSTSVTLNNNTTGVASSASITFSGLSVTQTATTFVSTDFSGTQRLVGMWSSNGSTFLGFAYVRGFSSTSVLALETPFFDPATGSFINQTVGNIILVSKNFLDLGTVTNLTLSNGVATINDQIIFGSGVGVTSTSSSATLTVASSGVGFGLTTHTFVAGQIVVFSNTIGTAGGQVVAGTPYYVLSSGLTTTAFQVSATSGGTAITFNAAGTSNASAPYSVCFYDQNIDIIFNYTFPSSAGGFVCGLGGGLVVFGKLESFTNNVVSNPVNIQFTPNNLTNDAFPNYFDINGIGAIGYGLITVASVQTSPTTAVNFCQYGGSLITNNIAPMFCGGNTNNTPYTWVQNQVQCGVSMISPQSGGSWNANQTRLQLLNCFSELTLGYCCARLWGDGVQVGGSFKFPYLTTAPYGALGNYGVTGNYFYAGVPGTRTVVLDQGGGVVLFWTGEGNFADWYLVNFIASNYNFTAGASTTYVVNLYFQDTLTFSTNSWFNVNTIGLTSSTSNTVGAICQIVSGLPTIVGGNSFVAGQAVTFNVSVGTTGVVAGTTYYISSLGLTSSQFQVSATLGGASIVFAGVTGAGTAGAGPAQAICSNASIAISSSPALLYQAFAGNTQTISPPSAWYWGVKAYGRQAVSGTITPTTYPTLSGTGPQASFQQFVNQPTDTGVGSITQTVANGYTSISTLDQLYAASSNWSSLSATNSKYPNISTYPITFSGTVLNLGNLNLVLATTGSAFSINTSTNTLTINSTSLATGTLFTSFTTTGTVTLGTGTSITVPYACSTGQADVITLTNLLSGSTVVTDNGIAITSSGISITLYTAPGASSTFHYAVTQYGYLPVYGTATVGTGSTLYQSITIVQSVDLGITQTVQATVASYATGSLATLDNIYDYWSYYLYTGAAGSGPTQYFTFVKAGTWSSSTAPLSKAGTAISLYSSITSLTLSTSAITGTVATSASSITIAGVAATLNPGVTTYASFSGTSVATFTFTGITIQVPYVISSGEANVITLNNLKTGSVVLTDLGTSTVSTATTSSGTSVTFYTTPKSSATLNYSVTQYGYLPIFASLTVGTGSSLSQAVTISQSADPGTTAAKATVATYTTGSLATLDNIYDYWSYYLYSTVTGGTQYFGYFKAGTWTATPLSKAGTAIQVTSNITSLTFTTAAITGTTSSSSSSLTVAGVASTVTIGTTTFSSFSATGVTSLTLTSVTLQVPYVVAAGQADVITLNNLKTGSVVLTDLGTSTVSTATTSSGTSVTFYTSAGASATLNYSVTQYGYLPVFGSLSVGTGSSLSQSITISQSADPGNTASASIVAAYGSTSIATLDNAYDYWCYYLYQTTAGTAQYFGYFKSGSWTATPLSKAGTAIQFTSNITSLTLVPVAAGSTYTTNNTTASGSAIIYFASIAPFSIGMPLSGTGIAPGSTIISIGANSVTLSANTTGVASGTTITFIGTEAVTSSSIVISNLPSTFNIGATTYSSFSASSVTIFNYGGITVQVPYIISAGTANAVTLNNLKSGSIISTDLASGGAFNATLNSGTSYTFYTPAEASSTLNYSVVQYGYLPIFGSTTVGTGAALSQSITISQAIDTGITAAKATVSAYTVGSLATLDNIYDYWSYALYSFAANATSYFTYTKSGAWASTPLSKVGSVLTIIPSITTTTFSTLSPSSYTKPNSSSAITIAGIASTVSIGAATYSSLSATGVTTFTITGVTIHFPYVIAAGQADVITLNNLQTGSLVLSDLGLSGIVTVTPSSGTSATFYTRPSAAATLNYSVTQYGYLPVFSSLSVGTGSILSQSALISQSLDPGNTATSTAVATYTTLSTLDNIYDYWSYYLYQTTTGATQYFGYFKAGTWTATPLSKAGTAIQVITTITSLTFSSAAITGTTSSSSSSITIDGVAASLGPGTNTFASLTAPNVSAITLSGVVLQVPYIDSAGQADVITLNNLKTGSVVLSDFGTGTVSTVTSSSGTSVTFYTSAGASATLNYSVTQYGYLPVFGSLTIGNGSSENQSVTISQSADPGTTAAKATVSTYTTGSLATLDNIYDYWSYYLYQTTTGATQYFGYFKAGTWTATPLSKAGTAITLTSNITSLTFTTAAITGTTSGSGSSITIAGVASTLNVGATTFQSISAASVTTFTTTGITNQYTYTISTGTSGVVTLNNLLTGSIVITDLGTSSSSSGTSITIYTPPGTYPTFHYAITKYGYLPVYGTIAGTSGVVSATIGQSADLGITQTTQSTVSSYTSLTTLDQIYDYWSYYLYATIFGATQYFTYFKGGSWSATPFSKSGTAIQVTSNITTLIFSTAAISGTVSSSSTSLTICGVASSLAVGANTYQTLSAASVTTFTTTGVTLQFVYTINTGTSLAINLTVPNGSSVAVLNGSGVIVSNSYVASNSGTSYAFYAVPGQTGSWTYRVAQYGSISYTSNPAFIPSGQISAAINLATDTGITQTNVNTVKTYTQLTTCDQLYDYAAYWQTTNNTGGIALPNPLTKNGQQIALGSVGFTMVTSGSAYAYNGTTITVNTGATFNTGTTLTNFATTGTITNSSTLIACYYTTAAGVSTVLTLSNLPYSAAKNGTYISILNAAGAQQQYVGPVTSGTKAIYIAPQASTNWTWKAAAYGFISNSNSFTTGGYVNVTVSLSTDTGITQGTVATVSGYLVLTNCDQLYDYAAYWQTTNNTGGILVNNQITKNANSVNCAALALTFNNSTGTPLTVTVASGAMTALTIQTGGTFVTGVTFNNFATSSTTTFTSTTVSCYYTNNNGTSTVFTLSNLPYSTNNLGTYVSILNASNSQVQYIGPITSGSTVVNLAPGGAAVYSWKAACYGYISGSSNFNTQGYQSASASLTSDPGITQTNVATVAGYATIANCDQLYDYAAYWQTTNNTGGITTAQPVSKNGTQVSLGSATLSLSTSAANVFAYNSSTSTITILSPANFVSGVTFISLGTSAASYTLSGVTLLCVYSTSAGTSTILTFTGLPVSASILITNTGNVQQQYIPSATSPQLVYIAPQTAALWNWKVANYGSLSETGSFTTGGYLSAIISLTSDTGITNTNEAAVAAYSSLNNLDQFYDYSAYWQTTNNTGGIAATQPVTKSGSVVYIGANTLTLSTTNSSVLSYNSSTNSLTAKCTGTFAPGVTFNEIQTTNSSITLSGVTLTCVYITSVGTSTVLELIGLPVGSSVAITNNSGVQQQYIPSATSPQYIYIAPQTSATWNWKVAYYGDIATGSPFTTGGYPTAIISLATDTGITNTNSSSVSTYTQLTTLDQIYDYAAYWETTSTGIAFTNPVTKAGTSISIGSNNLILNSAAANVFAYASPNITVDAGTVLTGTTFTSLTTTGSITTSGGAISDFLYTSSSGTSGVITFTGFTNGSRLYIANGSGTQQYNAIPSGTSYVLYIPAGATGTWKYNVAYYGKLAVAGTFTPSGAQTISISQQNDPGITQATVATVAAYTSLPTLDNVYDYLAYLETTSSGVTVTNPASKVATALTLSSTAVTFTNGTNATPAIISGTTLNIYVGSGLTLAAGATTFSTLNASSATFTYTGGTSIICLYTNSTGTSGIITFNNLQTGSSIYIANNSGTQYAYTPSTGTSQPYYIAPGATGTYTYNVAKYGFISTSNTFAPNGSSITVTVAQSTDTGITQTNVATVAGYATIANCDQLYDYAAYWQTTNNTGGISTTNPVVKNGTQISVGAKALVLNSGASNVFAYNGSTITVKSATTFATGITFTSFATTTTTTFTATSVTCAYTNSSGNSTVLTLSNVPVGASVSITNGSNVQQQFISSSLATQPIYIAPQASTTWNWKVAYYGNISESNPFTTSGYQNATVSLATDTGITNASSTAVAAYTTLTNCDQLYDYAAYYETTSTGILQNRPTLKNGTEVQLTGISLNISSSASTVWTYSGTSLTIKASSFGTGVTFTSLGSSTTTFSGVTPTCVYQNASGTSGVFLLSNLISGSSLSFSNASGVQQSYVPGISVTGTTYTYYIAPGATGTWNWKAACYGYISTNAGFSPTGYQSVIVGQPVDTSITQTNVATVAAYPTINTVDQLYDYSAYWQTTNNTGGITVSDPATKNGTSVSLGSNALVINATASSVYAYDGTSTVTIKSSSFGTGTTFTTFNTSSTLTLFNGAAITIVYTVGSGTSGSFTLTNMITGSTVYIANGSSTQVVNTVLSGSNTTYNLSIAPAAATTYSYIIAKYGYNDITGTFSSVGTQSVSINQTTDLGITNISSSAVAAYTTITTFDQLYDYAAYYKTTAAGIIYSRVATRSGSTVSLGSNALIQNATASSVFAYTTSPNVITIKGATLNTGVTFTTLNTSSTVSFTNGASNNSIYTSSAGTTAQLVLQGLVSGTSIYVQNASAVQQLYVSGQSGTYTFNIGPGASAGTWIWAIKSAGYSSTTGTFAPSVGGIFTVSPSTPQKLNADGTVMYQGTTISFLTVVFTGSTEAAITIGNGSISCQNALDASEVALTTQPGMYWLAAGLGECSIFLSAAGNFLFLSRNWRLKALNTGVTAILNGFAVSADNVPIDSANGTVELLVASSNSASTIAAAVWSAALSSYTTTGSAGEIIQLIQANSNLIPALL